MKKVAIIGSGFGGLALAIRLQARGYAVTIFEKNAQVGGHAYQFKEKGYTFDMGPSLITAPEIIRSVFRAAGRDLADYLDLVRIDPYYRIYFHDGARIDYSGEAQKMKAQMAAFNSGDAQNYDRFMRDCRGLYEAVITSGLGATPFMDLKTMLKFIPAALKLKALAPAHAMVQKYFQDPRHRFTFSFHPLFIGGHPFRAPSIYLMIPYLEKAGGIWFSMGGMYALVQAMAKVLLELGGEIRTHAEVTEIAIREGRAAGVSVDGDFHPADTVVSNADWAHTHLHLIKPQHRRKWTDRRIQSKAFSMSAFLLYLGVRRRYPQLLHHTLILSPRYRELVADIFDRKVLPPDFSMYLHAPTRTDTAMAPPGCESMYVLIPVPNLAANIDWKVAAQPYADRILNFLEEEFGLEQLRANLEVCRIFTPEDFQRKANSYLGSPWGLEPKLLQTAYFRPHNRSEEFPNLYFVGAGTHPGAGVPGVLLSAETTATVIFSDHKMRRGAGENFKFETKEPVLSTSSDMPRRQVQRPILN